MLEAFLTAFRMYTHTFQIRRRCPADKPEVCAAQDAKHLEGIGWFFALVLKPLCPEILVETGERRAVVSKDHPQAPRPHDFRVGEMLQNLAD